MNIQYTSQRVHRLRVCVSLSFVFVLFIPLDDNVPHTQSHTRPLYPLPLLLLLHGGGGGGAAVRFRGAEFDCMRERGLLQCA